MFEVQRVPTVIVEGIRHIICKEYLIDQFAEVKRPTRRINNKTKTSIDSHIILLEINF